jgi:hypothetical protein
MAYIAMPPNMMPSVASVPAPAPSTAPAVTTE